MLIDSPTAPDSSISKLKRLTLAAVLVVSVLAASLYSISTKRQLGLMGGMAEEYLELAINLHRTGNFQASQGASQPFLLRPPGYVKFLDLIFSTHGELKLKKHVFTSQAELDLANKRIFKVVYVSQGLLLAAATLVLFLHLGQLIKTTAAFVLALAFGMNPYLVIYVGLVHYEVLHIFFLLLSTWLLHNALIRKDGLVKYALWLAAGACWSCTTLIRPTSLIFPAVLAAAMAWHFRGRVKKAAVHWLVFVAAFAAVLMPWTWRNYQAVHRLLPVSAQSSAAFWGSSCKVLGLDANHYRWWQVWYPEGQKKYESITGRPGFDTLEYVNHNLEIEDELAAALKSNLLTKPQVYLTNVCGNFFLMLWGTNSVFVKIFQHLQHSTAEVSIHWFESGHAQDFHPPTGASACTALLSALALAGYAGVLLACKRRDVSITAPLCAFATQILAHTISYTDLMYYYTRVPFLFIFAAFALRHADRLPRFLSKIVSAWLLPALMAGTLWMYWFVIVA